MKGTDNFLLNYLQSSAIREDFSSEKNPEELCPNWEHFKGHQSPADTYIPLLPKAMPTRDTMKQFANFQKCNSYLNFFQNPYNKFSMATVFILAFPLFSLYKVKKNHIFLDDNLSLLLKKVLHFHITILTLQQ